MAKTNMAWSGTCEECLASVIVYPHYEADDATRERIAEGTNEWENFTYCYVCDGRIEWNGSDPTPAVLQ